MAGLIAVGGAILAAAGGFLYFQYIKSSKLFNDFQNAKSSLSELPNGGFLKAKLKVVSAPQLLAPLSGKSVVYYKTELQKWVVVRQKGKGTKARWQAVESKDGGGQITLTDGNRNLTVDLKKDKVNSELPVTYEKIEGIPRQGPFGNFNEKFRRIEWAISQGNELNMLAKIENSQSGPVLSHDFTNYLLAGDLSVFESKMGKNQEEKRTGGIVFIGIGVLMVILGLYLNM